MTPDEIAAIVASGESETLECRTTTETRPHREIHARLGSGVSERQVRRALEELRDKGLVFPSNRGPLTRWRRDTGVIGLIGVLRL